MDGCAYMDGDYMAPEEARISVFDLGFTRSDVVYDVVSTWHGLFFRLDDHVDRFLASCAGRRLTCPLDADGLKRVLATCVARAGLEDAYVAMVLTRGQFLTPGSRDPRHTKPSLIAYAVPYVWLASPEKQDQGLAVHLARDSRRIPDASVDQRYKNYHWGDLTAGLFEALDAGADTTLLLTQDGRLAEGPGFNLFFVSDGALHTPGGNILRGVTRQTVLDLAAELGVALEAGDYPAEALLEADEAFLTSTAGGILPVVRIDGRILSNGAPGALSQKFRALYWSKREAGWLGTPVTDWADEVGFATDEHR